MKPLLALIIGFLGLSSSLFSQSALKGRVTAGDLPVPFASIRVMGRSGGAFSDSLGFFRLQLSRGTHILEVTGSGFRSTTKTVRIDDQLEMYIEFELEMKTTELDTLVLIGSRSYQRSSLLSPLPIDVLRSSDLESTGQLSLDKQMQYKVPSFNTSNVPVSDATTFYDPYEIRNLGASRTLVLINGKRKNLTSMMNLGPTVGRGETGADLTSIPTSAIKRIEILRDGASAQYGSDAIAGVINIILKNDTTSQDVEFKTGFTHKGDGLNLNLTYNGSTAVSSKGSLNYTIDVLQQENAVRTGVVDVVGEQQTFGGTPAKDQAIAAFLQRYPTAKHRTSMGAFTTGRFLINAEISINPNVQLYGNAGLALKRFVSNANYRTPYWRKDFGLLHRPVPGAPNYTGENDPLYDGYLGYEPSFEGDLTDYTGTVGLRSQRGSWEKDLSLTIGGNAHYYTVANTVNASLGIQSPTYFKPGGYRFSHVLGNFDMNRKFSKQFSLAIGTEFRKENYEVVAGDEASYFGEGANSFNGINRANAIVSTRYNLGIYADASWDVNRRWLVNGAVRSEYYSDFGLTGVWKLASRYRLFNDFAILRTSFSSGLKAPSLHQMFTQQVNGAYAAGTVSLFGLFNNQSKEAFALGIPKLKAERAYNYTVGIGLRPQPKLNITLDYYNITINNRILYTTNISSSDPSTELYQILNRSGVISLQFFVNALKTNTSGLDFVMDYRHLSTRYGKIGFHLSGNLVLNNKIIGEPETPDPIQQSGVSLIDNQVKSLLETSRPSSKAVFGLELLSGKTSIYFNHTLFGKVSFQDIPNGGPIMNHVQQTFQTRIVSDLTISRQLRTVNVGLTINNIFNILPKWNLIALDQIGSTALSDASIKKTITNRLTFNGRYPIQGYYGAHFSQLGMTVEVKAKINL